MKHRIGYNRLGRRDAHRTALKNNMVTSLFRYERVETTKAKALEVKRVAEKLVTRARVDSVHNRRIVGERIHDKEILAKLFTEIAPRYVERPGGYTRVLKIGFRQGDAAQMVILELVDRKIEEKKARPQKEAAEEKEEIETPAAEKGNKGSASAAKSSSKKTAKAAASAEESVESGETEAPKAEVVEETAEQAAEEQPAEAEAPADEASTESDAQEEAEAAPKEKAESEKDAEAEDSEKKE